MRRRLVWPWILPLLVVVLVLLGVPRRPILYSQSGELTLAAILNIFYNPVTQRLQSVPYAGAQGPELTASQIFNLLYNRTTDQLNFDAGGLQGLLLAQVTFPCVPGTLYNLLDVSAETALRRCRADGLFLDVVGASNSAVTTGIRVTPTAIQSMRFGFLELSGTCVLGTNSFIRLTATPAGTTCVLPDPADTANAGYYYIEVADANSATLAPNGLDLLDGVNAPSRAIRGPRASFEVKWDGAGWVSTAMTSVGYGEPNLNICTASNGDTNSSSSGSGTPFVHNIFCAIPPGKLQVGAAMTACASWRMTTGTTAPTLGWSMVVNDTTEITRNPIALTPPNNLSYRALRQCIGLVMMSPTTILASPNSDFASFVGTDSWSEYGVVTIDPAIENKFSFRSGWATAGVGTNTITLDALTMEGARLAQ